MLIKLNCTKKKKQVCNPTGSQIWRFLKTIFLFAVYCHIYLLTVSVYGDLVCFGINATSNILATYAYEIAVLPVFVPYKIDFFPKVQELPIA